MTLLERMPRTVGAITLAAGAALAAAPGVTTRALHIEGEEAALRLVGAADLVLVPGLLLGRPRWPWMAARAALNLAQAGWLAGAARAARTTPALARGAAAALAALTLVDGPAAVALRRRARSSEVFRHRARRRAAAGGRVAQASSAIARVSSTRERTPSFA